MTNPQFPCARKTGLVVQDMPEEVLVYDLDTDKAHCLNGSAALIWRACDGKTSVADIASAFAAQTGDKVSEDFVWLAIDQLNDNRLLEKEITTAFAGQSRREVIKKIGLASIVALPVIASLLAPTSARAVVACNCTGNILICGTGSCAPTCDVPSGTCIIP